MKYNKIHNLKVSELGLGTWAFGSDKWWGPQDDKDSIEVLEQATREGVNLIDTAPIYGRGHSERLVGDFLKKHNRDNFVISTKLGLSWKKSRVFHDLSKKRILEELDSSRKRLDIDYIDIYHVHWPDPDTPISETASVMQEFYDKGLIKAIAVSNYNVKQMKEFMKYADLHILQPPYNMFKRDIENSIIPFCIKNNIDTLVYSPLNSGILTGKFYFGKRGIPTDLNRRNNKALKESLFSINKEFLTNLQNIAERYQKTVTQLILNWTVNQEGITSVLVGARNVKQIRENVDSVDWNIKDSDFKKINDLLKQRNELLKIHNP